MAILNQRASLNKGTDASRLKCLNSQEVDTYAHYAARLVSAGRLNKWFPDPFGCG